MRFTSNVIIVLDTVGLAFFLTINSNVLHPQSVTTREGDCFKTETPLSAEVKVTRIYEFKDDGMTVVSAISICVQN